MELTSIQRRFVLFLFGCMGARMALAWSVGRVRNIWLRSGLAVALLAMGLGFLVIYAGGLRKTGAETGGAPIWWNALRPLHGAIYVASALLLWRNHGSTASSLLVGDTLVGLVAFLMYHWRSGNLKKVFQ